MRKKSTRKTFKSAKTMDYYLETADLGRVFEQRGKISRPVTRKVNLDLPGPLLDQIDNVASKIGIARQPLLKMWIHEKLKEESRI